MMKYIEPRPDADHPDPKHWKLVSEQAKERDGQKCRICGATESLHVHHITYDRFGFEEIDDLTTLCKDHHELITSKNSQLKSKQSYIKEVFRKDGSLIDKGPIVDGHKEGLWTRYYEDGDILTLEYSKGKKHGKRKMYYSGNLFEEIDYVEGKMNGLYKGYYQNGQLRKVFEIKDEKPWGNVETWWENGQKASKGRLFSFNFISIQNEDLKNSFILGYVDLVKKFHGKWSFWDDTGRLVTEGAFVRGKRQGIWKCWNETDGEYQEKWIDDERSWDSRKT